MGRPLNLIPSYLYHPRGIGRTYWRGEFRDLPGDFNSPESLAAYHRLCQVVAETGHLPVSDPPALTVAGLMDRFADYAAKRYAGTGEARNIGYAAADASKLFGDVPASKFGPASLKAIRTAIVARGLCRATANRRTRMIVQIFAWAVEEEFLPPDVWQALKAVRPIPPNRDGAIDYDPVRPVGREAYRRTIDAIAPHYRVALEVQRMTGMRSGELLAMRPQDVDMTGKHWFYRLAKHKTRRHVGERLIGIPEPAAVLLHANMPKTWSDRWFKWRVDTHYHAVCRVCDKLGMSRWHPHQLRHGLATLCEQTFGTREQARLILGHTDARMTGRYAMATTEALSPILDEVAKALGDGA